MSINLGRATLASWPVSCLSRTKPRSDVAAHRMGSDLRHVGSIPKSEFTATREAWQSYPAQRLAPEYKKGFSLSDSLRELHLDHLAGDRAFSALQKANPANALAETWHTSFVNEIVADAAYQERRLAGKGDDSPSGIGSFGRPFDGLRLVRMIHAVADLRNECPSAAQLESPEEYGYCDPEEIQALRDRLEHDNTTGVVNEMLRLTTDLLERKRAEVKAETSALAALNGMACEAAKEVANGGGNVPLRLAVVDGQWVLKPAKSKSVFRRKQVSARADAARLALLLGCPADTPITLATMKSRGVGVKAYSKVLDDAKAGVRNVADVTGRLSESSTSTSWLGDRALTLDWSMQGIEDQLADLQMRSSEAFPGVGGDSRAQARNPHFARVKRGTSELSAGNAARQPADEPYYETVKTVSAAKTGVVGSAARKSDYESMDEMMASPADKVSAGNAAGESHYESMDEMMTSPADKVSADTIPGMAASLDGRVTTQDRLPTSVLTQPDFASAFSGMSVSKQDFMQSMLGSEQDVANMSSLMSPRLSDASSAMRNSFGGFA